MNLEAIFHALISILRQRQHDAASRLLNDPNDIVLGQDVPNGARLKEWLTHDGGKDLFEFLRNRGLLTEQPDEYQARNYTLRLDRPTLRQHLAGQPVLRPSDEGWLVGRFVEAAMHLGRGEIIGSVVLAGLHIHQQPFEVPPYFDEAMQALAAAGYCEYSTGTAKWLPKIAPVMQARGLWISNRTVDDVRTDRLADIWRTMPDELKRLTLQDDPYPDAYVLSCLMGEYWHTDSGWSFDGTLDPDVLKDPQGGHFPDASDISEMVEDGRLS